MFFMFLAQAIISSVNFAVFAYDGNIASLGAAVMTAFLALWFGAVTALEFNRVYKQTGM